MTVETLEKILGSVNDKELEVRAEVEGNEGWIEMPIKGLRMDGEKVVILV